MYQPTESGQRKIVVSSIIALLTLIISLCAWAVPFGPMGESPIKLSLTWLASHIADNQPLLLSETFDDPENARKYVIFDNISINSRKLRFSFDRNLYGVETPLPGQYEKFSLEFSVFPVGEIYDASVNILFRYHEGGWYEIQLRPRRQQVYAFKVIRKAEQESRFQFTQDWVTNSSIGLGRTSTLIRLDAEESTFSLGVNGQKVLEFQDKEPYLRGGIHLGAGAGEVAGVSVEVDDIRIWGR